TIVDISDGAVRIRARDTDTTMGAVREGGDVILNINLPVSERHFSMKGVVIRRAPEICVVRLDRYLKDGRFVACEPLKQLELKAELLNYIP
ncbi:MAG TPA: hypothetical protein VNW52_07565, partial [Burkholderiaceae bacterium]|nr:hypothetical protein [Burkholderiaceae bacterium]